MDTRRLRVCSLARLLLLLQLLAVSGLQRPAPTSISRRLLKVSDVATSRRRAGEPQGRIRCPSPLSASTSEAGPSAATLVELPRPTAPRWNGAILGGAALASAGLLLHNDVAAWARLYDAHALTLTTGWQVLRTFPADWLACAYAALRTETMPLP